MIPSIDVSLWSLNHHSDINQNTGRKVEDIQGMLGEIHAWWTSNLKGRTMGFHDPTSRSPETPLLLSFSLHAGDSEPFHTAVLCDNASFKTDWLQYPDRPVFKCNCQLRRTRYGDIHDEELMQYRSESNHPLYIVSVLIPHQCPR